MIFTALFDRPCSATSLATRLLQRIST